MFRNIPKISSHIPKRFSPYQVSDGDSFWMWARETLVPGFYAKEWYNGKKAKKGFIANMENYLVGVPRLRLVRVEKGKLAISDRASPYYIDKITLSLLNMYWNPL